MGHYISFVIHSWQDDDDRTMHWSIHPVDDPTPLQLPDGCFLLRTWIEDGQVVRGLLRHVQSGREMQFQSGQSALAFIRSWVEDRARVEPEGEGEAWEGTPHAAPGWDEGTAHG
jgi:hypothetical protein